MSQSSVATTLRYGYIIKNSFIANLLVNLSVQKFENRLTFGEVMDISIVFCFFLPRDAMLSTVYAVIMCLCVCLSHFGIVSKRLNVGSHK